MFTVFFSSQTLDNCNAYKIHLVHSKLLFVIPTTRGFSAVLLRNISSSIPNSHNIKKIVIMCSNIPSLDQLKLDLEIL